ncbi:hypothetical protein ON010_g9797 [Phytophthora cinnamomi]|nr:hypothetical protein ON010_g9797 [Phytophthora cinnamomi]
MGYQSTEKGEFALVEDLQVPLFGDDLLMFNNVVAEEQLDHDDVAIYALRQLTMAHCPPGTRTMIIDELTDQQKTQDMPAREHNRAFRKLDTYVIFIDESEFRPNVDCNRLYRITSRIPIEWQVKISRLSRSRGLAGVVKRLSTKQLSSAPLSSSSAPFSLVSSAPLLQSSALLSSTRLRSAQYEVGEGCVLLTYVIPCAILPRATLWATPATPDSEYLQVFPDETCTSLGKSQFARVFARVTSLEYAGTTPQTKTVHFSSQALGLWSLTASSLLSDFGFESLPVTTLPPAAQTCLEHAEIWANWINVTATPSGF